MTARRSSDTLGDPETVKLRYAEAASLADALERKVIYFNSLMIANEALTIRVFVNHRTVDVLQIA